MVTAADRGAVAQAWTVFADESCRDYAPLYDVICRAVAADDDLLDLVCSAPPPAHQPNVLLAAAHDLLLAGVDHPLAAAYAAADAGDAAARGSAGHFRDLCLTHRDAVAATLATRRTQTNECGRSAAIVVGLTELAAVAGEPLGLIDAGASAGLNLLCDEYRIDFGPDGAVGPAAVDAAVTIHCDIHGRRPSLPATAPAITHRVGIDRSPIDLDDEVEARWLLACTWPGTGRLARTRAAIALARKHRPDVRQGDLVADLGAAIAEVPAGVVPCVLTTWSLAYVDGAGRDAFVDVLRTASRSRPVAWLSIESIGVVAVPPPDRPAPTRDILPSILGLVRFEAGEAEGVALGYVHSHGAWIDLASDPSLVPLHNPSGGGLCGPPSIPSDPSSYLRNEGERRGWGGTLQRITQGG